jgi:hypothetical protein
MLPNFLERFRHLKWSLTKLRAVFPPVKFTVRSGTNMGKTDQGYREHASAGSIGVGIQSERSLSEKIVVTAWFKALVACSKPPRPRRAKRRRSQHDRSSLPLRARKSTIIEAHQCTIHHGEASQISIAKVFTEDSREATPCTTDTIEEPPSESAIILKLYHRMPYDNSIRLLRISRGILSGPVAVTLEFERLHEPMPAYKALSYVWGSSARVSQIIHEPTQEAISTSRNLYNARKGVREADQDRVIWVDALCINQEDRKETGVQVRKMNSMNTRASRVIVWLAIDEAGGAHGTIGALCALAQTRGAMARYATRLPQQAPIVPDSFVPSEDNHDTFRKVMTFCQTCYNRL